MKKNYIALSPYYRRYITPLDYTIGDLCLEIVESVNHDKVLRTHCRHE